MDSDETLTHGSTAAEADFPARQVLALLILWSADALDRVGEVLLCDAPEAVLGRGSGAPGEVRLRPVRMRPGGNLPQPPLASPRLSRRQLEVSNEGDALRLVDVGRPGLVHRGEGVAQVRLKPGDAVILRDSLVLGCVCRPARLPAFREGLLYPDFPFGGPDPFGLVGESPAAWALREEIAFVAGRTGHVLVRGPSGAGKELVGRAIHGLASQGRLVSRSAATLPESLVDAELFGNVRDYPNPGMPDRPGLIGEADGGTLLLDEIGELPERLQAHLLRVLDAGEYQRLGESRARISRFRLIAATNRSEEALKHDLAARLVHRVDVPGLDERAEDIPLIATALLQRRVVGDAWLKERFFEGERPRLAAALVIDLLEQRWQTHARQLERRLWEAMEASRGAEIALPAARLPPPAPEEEPEIDPAQIRAVLDRTGWVVSRAWRELGLRNRYQLARLMKRHGIER